MLTGGSLLLYPGHRGGAAGGGQVVSHGAPGGWPGRPGASPGQRPSGGRTKGPSPYALSIPGRAYNGLRLRNLPHSEGSRTRFPVANACGFLVIL